MSAIDLATTRIRYFRRHGTSTPSQCEACVAWAIGMLEAGRDSANLRMLASMAPPLSAWEMHQMTGVALEDLGVEALGGEAAAEAYAAEVMKAMIRGDMELKAMLEALNDIHVSGDPLDSLTQLCLLHYSYETVLFDGGISRYREDATRENFAGLVAAEVEAFLARRA